MPISPDHLIYNSAEIAKKSQACPWRSMGPQNFGCPKHIGLRPALHPMKGRAIDDPKLTG